MNETLVCIALICRTANPRPMCPPKRTQPEVESIANCDPKDRDFEERNHNVINQPNVCDSLPPSFDLKNEQHSSVLASIQVSAGLIFLLMIVGLTSSVFGWVIFTHAMQPTGM